MDDLFKRRFSELEQQTSNVEKSKKPFMGMGRNQYSVDSDLVVNWSVKVKNLLSRLCGTESTHLNEFVEAEKKSSYEDSSERFSKMKAVFLAAKEDYEGGYIVTFRSVVQAEVFGSEIEQATELIDKGYKVAAAVIAGTVLETALRALCDRNQLPHGRLDKMNADLVKAGVYNTLMQKRITALAAIRNSAAHGKPTEFSDDDVRSMIADVERFLADHIT